MTMKKAASWFAVTITAARAESPVTGRPSWGFAEARIDYDRGGYTVAIAPLWLVGFFHMRRLIQGRTRIGSTAGVFWNRYWKRGQAAGWVKVTEFVSAADARLLDAGTIDVEQWRQSAAMLAAQNKGG